MKSDRERELWLLKITSEHGDTGDEIAREIQPAGSAQPLVHGNKFKWGAIAIAGMTTASLVLNS